MHFGVMLMLITMIGCSTPQSSRITIEDYDEIGARMAQSLRHSDAFANRSADSEPMIIAFDKVLNLSSEIMTRSERWGLMAGLQASQPIQTLWYNQRVVFVIPAQYAVDRRGTIDAERLDKGFGSERGVTHIVTATFRSIERVGDGGDGRTDSYRCDFTMIDLKTNAPVWNDSFTFKRTAKGSIRD